MTTEKWQLYSQTGVDGPEYGVRIRTGYTVVGFQKEDAQAIVAWQNASIQPEGDIMEKAKALRNAALPRQTYSIPGQTGYGNPSLSKGWDFSAVDELVRVVVLELIAEVERLRSLEKCISPVIDRQGKTNAALLGQLDVISAYLDTEMAEWKNGDQIAEIAIKFMDRQKQNLNDANSQIAAKNDKIAQDAITIQMHHGNVLTLQKEVERLRSQSVEQVFRRSKGLLPQSHPRARGGDEECGCKT